MILAIDPSLTRTAVIGISEGKILHTWIIPTQPSKARFLTAAEKDAERVALIVSELARIITETKPRLILAEQSLGASQSAVSTKALALVAGALTAMATLRHGDVPWVFVRVHDVKRAFTGRAAKSKLETIELAAAEYPELRDAMISDRPGVKWRGDAEHLADAAAVYTAWAKKQEGGGLWSMSSGAYT